MALFRLGPSGGIGGARFDDETMAPAPGFLESSFANEVQIKAGRFVDSIQFSITHRITSQVAPLPRHGGSGGTLYFIRLDDGELIVEISGRYGRFLDSITIVTVDTKVGTSASHGPFGGSGGDVAFVYQAPIPPIPPITLEQSFDCDIAIVGLFGRAGQFVDQLGVIIQRPLFTS